MVRLLARARRLSTDRVALPRQRNLLAAENDGQLTVKAFESHTKQAENGRWWHRSATLMSDSTAPSCQGIVWKGLDEGALTVVVEFVEVLGPLLA